MVNVLFPPDPEMRAPMLHLNNLHAEQTSLLDAGRLDRMLEAAFLAGTVGALGQIAGQRLEGHLPWLAKLLPT